LPSFTKEFEEMLAKADKIYESEICLRQQKEALTKNQENEKQSELNRLNDMLNRKN